MLSRIPASMLSDTSAPAGSAEYHGTRIALLEQSTKAIDMKDYNGN